MSGIDTAPLILAQESVMGERCRITRNTGGRADDTLDPVTLREVSAAPTVVYEGSCVIARMQRQYAGGDTPTEDAGAPAMFRLKLALTELTLEPAVGDLVECLSSYNDPGLPSTTRTYKITAPVVDGFAASRVCEMVTTWAYK